MKIKNSFKNLFQLKYRLIKNTTIASILGFVVIATSLGLFLFSGNTLKANIAITSNYTDEWDLVEKETGHATMSYRNGELYVQIINGGSNPSSIQARNLGKKVEYDLAYRISFEARAISSRSINVHVAQRQAPSMIYAEQDFNLTTEMKTYNFSFAMLNTVDDAAIVFNLGSSDSDVYINNVELTIILARKGPYLIGTGNNTEMKVLWQLREYTEDCTLEWGTDTDYSSGSALVKMYGDNQYLHIITGLTPGQKYYYRVNIDDVFYTGSFRTAAHDNETDLKFLVYGDTRTLTRDHNFVASMINSTLIDDLEYQTFICHTGDFVENGYFESSWDKEFFGLPNVQIMLSQLPLYGVMGNHDGIGNLFRQYFPFPYVGDKNYWSLDYGPAHIVFLDQYNDLNYSGISSDQYNWLANDLASTDKQWKFIILHDNATSVQKNIQPLCEKYDVALVFAGHNHYYARAVVNGVQHITTGGGGAPLHQQPYLGYKNIVATAKTNHFCKVAIKGDTLTLNAVAIDGTIIDSVTLNK